VWEDSYPLERRGLSSPQASVCVLAYPLPHPHTVRVACARVLAYPLRRPPRRALDQDVAPRSVLNKRILTASS
jgi:hypothetical protein